SVMQFNYARCSAYIAQLQEIGRAILFDWPYVKMVRAHFSSEILSLPRDRAPTTICLFIKGDATALAVQKRDLPRATHWHPSSPRRDRECASEPCLLHAGPRPQAREEDREPGRYLRL